MKVDMKRHQMTQEKQRAKIQKYCNPKYDSEFFVHDFVKQLEILLSNFLVLRQIFVNDESVCQIVHEYQHEDCDY